MDFAIRIGRGPRCRYDRCRRAIPHCSSDDAASIPKSGLEIKNRCTQQCINGENLASIPKFGPEIKNRCTQEDINGEILASIPKSASRGFDSGGRAGADAPGGGISLCFCRRGCAAPAFKAATLNVPPPLRQTKKRMTSADVILFDL